MYFPTLHLLVHGITIFSLTPWEIVHAYYVDLFPQAHLWYWKWCWGLHTDTGKTNNFSPKQKKKNIIHYKQQKQ